MLLLVHVWHFRPDSGTALAPPVSSAQVQLRLDPNRATAAELELLPRIGEKLAANIIAYRDSVACPPAFRRAEDLDQVQRIGPVTVELLRPYWLFPEHVLETSSHLELP